MPPTLGAVAALPQLRLRTLTSGPLDVPVRWVAVSELEDPTPFLEGGELLLTTGMRVTSQSAPAYVARLARRGVAGLGFGVGLSHDEVPDGLVDAARAHGFPVLEVARPVPFIAIGKAVSRMLAAEWYEDVTRAFQAQRDLTRAALKGPGPLITRLARTLAGWALLLDANGAVRHAEPARASRHAVALVPELERLRTTRSSVTVSEQDGHVVLQGLGGPGRRRPRAFLAVGTRAPLPHVANTIVGAAVALLTLQLETPQSGRVLRAALGSLLLGLPPQGAAVPAPPVRVIACAGGATVIDALEADPAGERCLAVPLPPGSCALIVPDDLTDQVVTLARATGSVGVSDPADPASAAEGGFAALEQALRQAERALAAARRVRTDPGRPYGALRYGDLPGQGLLGLLDQDAAQGFAAALLAPLRAADPVLVPDLRAYLAANGQLEAAARARGVHRHTMRDRMRRAARLLDRDLDDPAVRAELWVALAITANEDGTTGLSGAFSPGPA